MTTATAGLIKASEAWARYRTRLPWRNRATFYQRIAEGHIPSVHFGLSLYVPVSALEALCNGDVDALKHSREPVAPGSE